ncbi:MAG TPA: ABC transporter substrate-binding protein [Candidatus Eisenbacteria bacterium]|nr:ABC transporter substrate-binding protein [Candidatus Eisenbacteria bacterium]
MRAQKIAISGLLLLAVVAVPEARAQKANFTVGFSAFSSAFMPAFVADQSGYFSQEGVGVRLVFFQSGVSLMQSVIAGEAHIGMGSVPELVTAVNAGARVRAVWGISNLMPFAVITRPHIRTFNDLKGKRIAVSSRGSLSEFLMTYVLKHKGIDSREVTYLAVGGVPTRFAAIQSGAVDASLISSAHFEKAKQSGLNLLFMVADLIPEWPQNVIYVREEFLNDRDAEFRSFLKAYRRGVATAKKNPASTIAAMQKALRFDYAVAKEGYHSYVHSLPDDGAIAEKGLELSIDQMAESGTIKRRFAVSDLIDYRYIHEAQKK